MIRLLDIIFNLCHEDINRRYQQFPFFVGEDGAVVLNADLQSELNKEENQDLIEWAHKNIMGMFL